MSIRIVLTRISHPGNIGSAARAMKTMGLGRLCLVAPDRFPATEATVMAAGAQDVLDRAQVFPDVRSAVARVAPSLPSSPATGSTQISWSVGAPMG